MQAILLTVILATLIWVLYKLHKTRQDYAKLQDRVDRQMASLTRRVFTIETGHEPEAPAATPPAPVGVPVSELPPAPPLPPAAPEPIPIPVLKAKPGKATERNRQWEATLGGNWLNKAGVLVLVIGIALFIGYAFTLMGAAGRVALAATVGGVMLAGGAMLEPNSKYRVFARGLIGGGWATLYVTAYAAHAMEAARLIESPVWATVLLAVVSAAIVAHSLRYRSEAVSGVAFFVAFATLAVVPLSFFAAIALVPLAVSLLWLSRRYSWSTLAIPGLVATYGVYLLQAARVEQGDLWAGQSILVVYWLVFEAFDLLRTRSDETHAVSALVFPLNAIGWIGLSILTWNDLRPDSLDLFFALAAAIYLASVFARVYVAPPALSQRPLTERLMAGSHEGALAIASGATAAALVEHFSGTTLTVALLIEAQLLWATGWASGRRFLRAIGATLLGLGIFHLVIVDLFDGGEFMLAGHEWRIWTPVALLAIGLLYANRFLGNAKWQACVATVLSMMAVMIESREEYVGLLWLALATLLLAAACWKRGRDLVIQSSVTAGLGMLLLVALSIFDMGSTAQQLRLPQIIGASFLFATAAAFFHQSARHPGQSTLLRIPASVCSLTATVLTAALLHGLVAPQYAALAWGLLSLALLVTGHWTRLLSLRTQGYSLALVVVLRSWFHDLPLVDEPGDALRLAMPVISVVLMLAAIYFLARVIARTLPDSVPAQMERYTPPAVFILTSGLLAGLLAQVIAGNHLTVAWGVQGTVTLAVGLWLRERVWRLTGLVTLLSCILKLFLHDLRNLDTLPRIFSFVVLGALLIAVSWVYTRFAGRLNQIFAAPSRKVSDAG